MGLPVQIICKIAVALDNPVVITSLAVVAVHTMTLATLWMRT